MRKIKCLISFFLILFGIVITNEICISGFLKNTLIEYYPEFIVKNNNDFSLKIKKLSEKYNLGICVCDAQIKDNTNREIKFICSDDIQEKVEKIVEIPNKKVKSLLFYESEIKYYSLDDTKLTSGYITFYPICSSEQIGYVKDYIYDEFDVFRYTEKTNNDMIIFGIWCLISGIILSFTYYCMKLDLKKVVISISLGYSSINITLKYILKDILIVLVEFLIATFVVSLISTITIAIKYIIISMVIICVLNSIIYLKYLNPDFKIAINSAQSNRKILNFNYIMWFGISLFCTITLSFCMVMGDNFSDLIKAEKLISKFPGYYSIKIECFPEINDFSYKTRITTYEKIYRENFLDSKAVMLNKVSDDIIYANSNSYRYIAEHIEPLRRKDKKEDIYICIPDDVEKTNIIDSVLKRIYELEGNDFNFTYDIITYKTDIEVAYFDVTETLKCGFKKNPIVVYNTINPSSLTTSLYCGTSSMAKDNILYQLDDDKFEKIVQEFSYDSSRCYKDNILNSFNERKRTEIMILAGISAIAFLTVIVNILTIFSIVKIEYSVNALKYSLLKIHGYSLIKKHLGIFLFSVFTKILSVIVSCKIVINLFPDINYSFFIIETCVLLVTDIIVIMVNITKIENTNIQKILKGGAL